jgi:hypothetical protein
MTVLHLGVVDQPYRHVGHRKASKRGKRIVKAAKISSRSTYEVACILEAKYGIMHHFFKAHENEIIEAMINAYEGAREQVQLTGRFIDPSADGINDIQIMFNRFIDEKEMDRMGVAGVPTAAALHGVSHRFFHPYAKRGPRASFYDTGLYEDSFRAWVD